MPLHGTYREYIGTMIGVHSRNSLLSTLYAPVSNPIALQEPNFGRQPHRNVRFRLGELLSKIISCA